MGKKEPQIPVRNLGFITLAMSYSRTTYRCTTIGAAAFHFRVRNGNGWGHCARITRKLAKSKLARGGMGGGLTLNFTRKSDDQSDWEMWLEAAGRHGPTEANHASSTLGTP